MKKLTVIFIVSLLIQLILLSKTVSYGEKKSSFQEKIDFLEKQNQELELKIASKTSFFALEKEKSIFQALENGIIIGSEAKITLKR